MPNSEFNKLKQELLGMVPVVKKITRQSELINFIGLVSWEHMTSAKVETGERVKVGEAVNYLEFKSETHWVWDTIIPNGKWYQNHKHDFIEVCVVNAGVLTEKITAERFKEGMYVIYEYEEPHEPGNEHLDDCHLTVHWVKTDRVDKALNVIRAYNQKIGRDEL